MTVPGWFSDQLRAEHGSRYRVRWSNALEVFLLEEKTARGITTPPLRLLKKLVKLEKRHPGITEEKLEQARSGYTLFLQVVPSPKFPCPGCGITIHLKPHAIEWATCTTCKKNVAACHISLGWELLEHLRYLDYERGGDERILDDMDRANDHVERTDSRDLKNSIGSMAREDYNMLHQIESVGYTGKTFTHEGDSA